MKLIDKDALMDVLGIACDCKDCRYMSPNFCGRENDFIVACERIKDAPTIDAVEVVRCRDCIWYEIAQLKKDGTEDRRYKPSYCSFWDKYFEPDWFCAEGERRTE